MKTIAPLQASILRATEVLLAAQNEDGHWVFELEAGAWPLSDYVLLVHFLGEVPDDELERKMAQYLRRTQLPDGGWPMVTDGMMDVSLSVRAYFTLKIIGDSPNDEHMIRARRAILMAGGAEACNVITRTLLALFGEVSWNAVPIMPLEIILLPKWFPFHLSKVSCWARVLIVPLLVLTTKRTLARNPRGIRIKELFRTDPQSVGLLPRAQHQAKGWFWFFRVVDGFVRCIEPLLPSILKKRAINAAVTFVHERLNGEDGFGALSPAMVTALMMFEVLGYPPTHPDRVTARQALNKLLVIRHDEAYCQPCLSPVWDTALTTHALLETGDVRALMAARRGLKWLLPLQILDERGDWSWHRPNLRSGGWAFGYSNPRHPDVDDTAVTVMVLHRMESLEKLGTYKESIARGREWVLGMQNRNGGWGAFEADNSHYYLNNIPFSDHGGLLDPPTADVTARCLSMLAQLGEIPASSKFSENTYHFLLKEQEANGSWYGRWGINYIWGTWSVLCALNVAGLPHEDTVMRRAVEWLVSIQNKDGGWGEDASSYKLDYRDHEPARSTASQTSWALLGLMAAGEVNHPAVARGIAWLMEMQREDGFWDEARYTGTGVQRFLYLRYHGYCKFFPLWALARYRNLKYNGLARVTVGL